LDSINNSTSHLWTKPRIQRSKRSKDEVLLDISSITKKVIDLRQLNVADLELVLKHLKNKTKLEYVNVSSKLECSRTLENIISVKSSLRLSLSDLRALVGVFNEQE